MVKARKKPKKWLTAKETDAILDYAKARSTEIFLILVLCRWGLRIGEICGRNRLPGIYVRDIRAHGFFILRKNKKVPKLCPVPLEVVEWVKLYAAKLELTPDQKLFGIGYRWVEVCVKDFARVLGIEEWQLVGPHRLRAYLATDAKKKGLGEFQIRDTMDHKNIKDTNEYVGPDTPEEVGETMDLLADTDKKRERQTVVASEPSTELPHEN